MGQIYYASIFLRSVGAAAGLGVPLFCLPSGQLLDATKMSIIIGNTYQSISSQQSDKNSMTISQIAWLGVQREYPCTKKSPLPGSQAQEMAHMHSLE